MSDGDDKGRGTGVFLDTVNGGTKTDQLERKSEIVINKYKADNPYPYASLT